VRNAWHGAHPYCRQIAKWVFVRSGFNFFFFLFSFFFSCVFFLKIKIKKLLPSSPVLSFL